MSNIRYKKGSVIGIICILMLVSAPISVGSERLSNEETTTTISIKTASSEDELDIIFSDFKEKMRNVDTKEECNIIFKEAIIELDEYGLLGGISVDYAYKLVSSSANDKNTYSVSGESTRTYFLESFGIYWYDIYKHEFLPEWKWIISGILWPLFLKSIKLPYHTNSWITYGYGLGNWEGRIDDYIPAEGYINIVGPEGEEEFNGNFYGQMFRLDGVGGFLGIDNIEYHYVGIKGFKGWNIGDYYFGTAEEIHIASGHPNL